MTFVALLAAIRRRWLWVVAGLVVGLVVASAVTLFVPRTYASTASLYVSAVDDTSAQNAYQGVLLSQQRVKSYTEIVTSDRVLRPVMDRAGIAGTTADFARDVAVSTDTESTLLRVTVTDADPQRAADLTNLVAARFVTVVGELERSKVAGSVAAVTVSPVDTAVADPTPVSPRWEVNLVVGAVLGLVLGTVGAVVRASTDRSIRVPSTLAGLAGAPSLGTVPTVPRRAGAPEPDPAGEGGYAEAVRRVRTNIQFADVDTPPKVLTITSSVAGEGKTTLSAALAAAFGVTSRVVLVEGDLRRPQLAARLGLAGGVGLTDVLRRRAGLTDALQRWSGVDVLTSGAVPHDPSSLLSSRALGEVLTRLRETYDVVIVDAPPLGPVADAAVLASRADGTVLLCRAGATSADAVAASVEALRTVGARVTGTVLTMAGPDGGSHGATGYGPTVLPPAEAEQTSRLAVPATSAVSFDSWFTATAPGPAAPRHAAR